MAWPKGMPRNPQRQMVAEPMTEHESAELDEMVAESKPVAGVPENQPKAAAQPAAVPPAPPVPASSCEFCGASPKRPAKGFDCQCMRRQTPEGKLASARAKEAMKAAAEKA